MRASVITSLMVSLFLTLAVSTGHAIDISVVGADPGPNATGEIPAWEGNRNLPCPDDWQPGQYFPDPYEDEKPLFRIDYTNVDEQKDRLSPAQIARLKKHKNFYMNIYPTHRTAEYFPKFYEVTAKNRETAYLDDKGVVQAYGGAIPFPSPKNGLEAIWNIRRQYLGDDAVSLQCRRLVSPSGKVKKTMWDTKVLTYGDVRLRLKPIPNPDELYQKLLTVTTYPADEKGVQFLSYSYMDDNKLQDTWLFMPTLRRVRRAPSMANGGQLDGELTMDENGMEFRGTVNNWNWKLYGKKEMYVAYNCYGMFLPDSPDEDECWAMDLNPKRIRYELHRVWVVEGVLKEGLDHPYSRRVSYYDEDTWQPVLGDRYDKRGNLWRMYEAYTYPNSCNKMWMTMGFVYMNLESGRYELFGGCRRQLPTTTVYDTNLSEDLFTVQALRKSGR